MRAIYYPFYKTDLEKNLIISDDQAKHLQVVRIRAGEKVLVLNGKGLKAHATVGTISKNQVELIVGSVETETRLHEISLAIANPKKDAFEDILKMAVELGVKNIYPLRSEFSQYDYEPSERVERIVESALIQSNNPFLPEIHVQKSIEQFIETNQTPLYFFNSLPSENKKLENPSGEIIILIGPEGGFSQREVELIVNRPKVFSIHMSTPIQRAPTAVASSIGYLLGLRAPDIARS